jgi:2-polyprenyl-3-methyl-5-hydroxy-6-metoxy-1,4-benzoquinol methylase
MVGDSFYSPVVLHSDRLSSMQQPDRFADEAFWTATYPFMFPEDSFEITEIPKIVALTACPNGASALDLCCGPGRHSVPLAKHGFNVIGVDGKRE